MIVPHGPLFLQNPDILLLSPLRLLCRNRRKTQKQPFFIRKICFPLPISSPFSSSSSSPSNFPPLPPASTTCCAPTASPSGCCPWACATSRWTATAASRPTSTPPCTATFESDVRYNDSVTGTISRGQIAGLSGISAQDLFLWFPVLAIRLDDNASGIIHFDVGVVDKRLPLSLFEDPPKCTPLASLGVDQSGELRQEIDRDAAKQTAI